MSELTASPPLDLRAVDARLREWPLSMGVSVETDEKRALVTALLAALRETHAILGAARSWLADNCPVAVEVACDTVLANVKDE